MPIARRYLIYDTAKQTFYQSFSHIYVMKKEDIYHEKREPRHHESDAFAALF